MLLIDGDHLLVYRIGFAIEKDKNPDFALKYNIRNFLDSLINKLNDYDRTIFLTGKDNFRNEVATILPYKGNRSKARRPKYYEQIRAHLVEEYDAVVVDGMEADDMMGIMQVKHTTHGEDDTITYGSTIVACDKDMLMIPGMHYNPMKNVLRCYTEVEAYRNFCMQCLTGDDCDNIPGLLGVGPVKAERILSQCGKSIVELDSAVYEAYRNAIVFKDGKNFIPLKHEGIGDATMSESGEIPCLEEIKKLLWIRRE